MAGLFDWSEGQTFRTATLFAAAACALATATGAAAERFAERQLALAEIPLATSANRAPANAIDYGTTGSVAPSARRGPGAGACADR